MDFLKLSISTGQYSLIKIFFLQLDHTQIMQLEHAGKTQRIAYKYSQGYWTMSAQSALPLLDHFSYVFGTDEREHLIGKSLKTV